MNKVIVTACVAVFAAVSAQAQGMGTVRDINGFGKEYLAQAEKPKAQLSKVEQARVDSISKAAERAAFLAAVRQRKAKKAGEGEKKEEGKTEVAVSCPSCYTGSTGAKMMMYADTKKGRQAKQNAAQETAARDTTEEVSWWRALAWWIPFPGESDTEYRERMAIQGQPASMPFK